MPNDIPRVYFDPNIFICALERGDERGLLARDWMLRAERREIQLVTSEITLAEVLSQPIQRCQHALVEAYRLLLTTRPSAFIAAVNRSTILSAARLRADLKLNLPDALHVATALQSGCGSFLTEDHRLRVPPDLRKLCLHDVADPLPGRP